MQAEIFQRL